MIQQQEQGFIGSRLKLIPHSHLVYSTPRQLLLNTKRQIIRLDTASQTLVYSNIEDQKVIHVAYHPTLEVYCLLTQKHILFVNDQGQLIKKITNQTLVGSQFFFVISMDDGYKGQPNHRDDLVIYVKSDYLYIATAKVFYERQMIKSKGIYDMGLEVEQTEMIQSPEFVQHAKYLPQVSMLILWNSKETWIYKTPLNWEEKFQRLYIYNKISKRQNLSLEYEVSLPSTTLAVGFESGVIKIFRLDQSRKYILDLKGHQTACTTLLVPANNPYLLYSASLDSTVRIWNLRDYEQVYMLQLDLLIKSIKFVSDTLLFLTTDELKSKSYLCQINTSLLDPIVNDNRSGHLLKMRCDQDWCISIYSNQLIEFMSIANLQQTPQNQKVEFPLQYGTIVDVFRLDADLYAVSLEKGFSLVKFDKNQIRGDNFDLKKLVYNESIIRKKQQNDFLQLIHQKLLDTYIFNAISDWKEIPTAINLTSIYFHKNSYLPMWNLTTHQRSKPKNEPANYCMLGNNKGQIYFVDIAKRTQFTTKVHFHSEPVTLIRQIKHEQEQAFSTFVSVSLDHQIVIWNLGHKECPYSLANFNYNRNITYMEVYEKFMLVGEKSGEFNLLELQVQQSKLSVRKSNNTTGHLRAVICGDYLFYKQSHLFLSGGEDSTIKIWKGVQKELIFQLKLFGIINTVNFIHQRLNLIVCHNEQISFIKQDKLKSLGKADFKLSHPQLESKYTVENVNLRDFFMQEVNSPLSPVKKGYLRLQRYGSLIRNVNQAQQAPFSLSKKDHQHTFRSSSFKKNLHSTPLLEQTSKRQKVKRFHAFSIEQLNKEVQLPRIKMKNPSSYNTPRIKKEHEIIKELKDIRNKSLSMAGRKPL